VQGFVLQEADVNELLRAAKAVEETQLYIDPAYPPDLVSDLLQRTVRLLQVAMEFQYKETEDVVIECNNLREDYQVPLHATRSEWQAAAGGENNARGAGMVLLECHNLCIYHTWLCGP
jgi:hypothetical protein